jgi:hypothetical protein
VIDESIEHGPAIVRVLSALLVTWFASFVAVIRPYGAFGWAVVLIVTYLLLSLAYWLGAVGKQLYMQSRFEEHRADAIGVNPLDGNFARRRIRLTDFFHPFFKPILSAKFQECELLGPAAVSLGSCTLLHCTFNNCEAVIVKKDATIAGATAYRHCIFDRCTFFGVTFLLDREQYLSLTSAAGDNMRVISDGRAGEL